MADMLKLELVSPEAELLTQMVREVVIPGAEGAFAAMPGHAPVLAGLRPGVLAIVDDTGASIDYFVRGGFAEVDARRVVVLAERAIPLAELDTAELEREIRWAQEDLEDARDEEERRKRQERLDFLKQLKDALRR